MKTYRYPDRNSWPEILTRPSLETQNLESIVSTILEEVRTEGDTAVRRYTAKFDYASLQNLEATPQEFESARTSLEEPLKQAIRVAHENIVRFHAAQASPILEVETMPGVRCKRKSVPIPKVGLYIPGGTAPLFSSVLMLGVPAILAGCPEIILCTPPAPDGTIHPAILFAAETVGIRRVFKIGGVQAIAAMAFGTASVPAVYKIFGPGNQYVTAAKQMVSRMGVAIDLPAGPSEVLVCADNSAVPAFVAADLLSQAEHGADSQVVLVSFDEGFVKQVKKALDIQLQDLPRKEIAQKALANSVAVVVRNRQEALEIIDTYAPEHLILSVANPDELAEKITNAGSVFLGNYTPESVGDYASGTNHTLPTNGFARAYSGTSLDSFVKKITFQELSREGLATIAPTVEAMAAAERLEAHARAVRIRLNHISTLVRPNILNLTPYSSARSEFKGKADIFLDANENPFENGLNRYPDPLQGKLKSRISVLKNIPASNIFLGNGSDEAIDLLVRIFCEPGQDHILILPPTYGMYQVAADIAGVEVRKVPLDQDFQPDVEAICQAAGPHTKILFLCSPNNPTGNLADPAIIRQIAVQFPGISVIYEAYMDFASTSGSLELLTEFPKLVILQTLSKAWGLAGIRLGMAFAGEEIITLLNKVKPPYNVNLLSQEKALEALENPDMKDQMVRILLEERQRLADALHHFPFVLHIYPSDANFLLVRVNDPDYLYTYLTERGLIVRNRSTVQRCEGCLRISVGTPEENTALLKALQTFSSEKFVHNPPEI